MIYSAPETTISSEEFPLDEELIYLNHAALGPWPRRTVAAIENFSQLNMTRSSFGYRAWVEAEDSLRTRLARLLGADEACVALQKNTSEALSTIASGLHWAPGDNVVLAAQEFPSNRLPWQALTARGVECRLVDIDGTVDPEQRLIDRCDGRTRLLATSSVHYASGVRMDLARLAGECRDRGVLTCVDVIQSLGALPLNTTELGLDFVACGSHKWLLAPEGIGFLYCRPELLISLDLDQFGWRMCDDPLNFDKSDWEPSETARRFECGTLNTLGMVALDASLSLLQEVGVHAIGDAVLAAARRLMDGLELIGGVTTVTPNQAGRHAGIVALDAGSEERNQSLFRHLRQHQVMPALRHGWVRLSPHFYTSAAHLDQVLALIEQWATDPDQRR